MAETDREPRGLPAPTRAGVCCERNGSSRSFPLLKLDAPNSDRGIADSPSAMQVSTPAAPARGRARNNTRLHALAESCTRCLFRAKRPSAQWCVSPECKFGPDRDRRLDTGGAAQSATPYGRLKFSPRSRPNCLRKVTSEGRCSMGAGAERKCLHAQTSSSDHRADCVVLGGEKHYRYSRYRDTMEVTLPRIPPERVDVVLGMDVLEAFHVTIHEDQHTMVY